MLKTVKVKKKIKGGDGEHFVCVCVVKFEVRYWETQGLSQRKMVTVDLQMVPSEPGKLKEKKKKQHPSDSGRVCGGRKECSEFGSQAEMVKKR